MASQEKPLAIQIEKLTKRYRTGALKSNLALDDVTLKVSQGEVFGFLGPNGAGKTTLIKILVGIMGADSGTCRILGLDTLGREAKLKLGYLPERPYFHDFLTSAEFLRFHGRLLGMTEDAIESRIPALLKKVGMSKSRDQKLRTFSKGMLQRIGFAQALLHDPAILVLDEPMSGLDPVGRREVRDIISEIAGMGKTIFFSTHIIHDVEVVCTTVGFINGGKLKGSGNIESLLGRTVKSMEVRYSLPDAKDPGSEKMLKTSRRTMDGWVLDIESDVDDLEDQVNKVLAHILSLKGNVRAVVPRKSTLEDLFFEGSR
ncbi:MAG: ABC transporter ATP-binding protein [Bdellovibrionota bacterium]